MNPKAGRGCRQKIDPTAISKCGNSYTAQQPLAIVYLTVQGQDRDCGTKQKWLLHRGKSSSLLKQQLQFVCSTIGTPRSMVILTPLGFPKCSVSL